MTDSLGQSQVIPYLIGLSKKGFSFTLISCEKEENYTANKEKIAKILSDNNANIVDFRTVRDNDTSKFSLFLDVDVLNSTEEIVSFEIKNLANAYAGYIDFNTVEEVDL